MRHYVELTKPRITWLILMSTGVGYFFGLNREVPFDWALLFHTLVGTALIASGTAALNQWWERESDKLMRRTASRPLPMGLLTANRALWFGLRSQRLARWNWRLASTCFRRCSAFSRLRLISLCIRQ